MLLTMFESLNTLVFGFTIFCSNWKPTIFTNSTPLEAYNSQNFFTLTPINISHSSIGISPVPSYAETQTEKVNIKYSFKYFSRESKYQINGDIGESVYLNCEITTNEKPTITWFKDDKILKERSYRFFYELDFEHLYILNFDSLLITDNGNYKCVVGEKNETQISKLFSLKVEERHRFEILHITSLIPNQLSVNNGEHFKITCTAAGDEDQPMFFRWDHRRLSNDTTNWTNHKGVKYHVITLKIDACRGKSVLKVFQANASNVGEYVCIVFNKNTFATKSAIVAVRERGKPSSATLSSIYITLITFFCIIVVVLVVIVIIVTRLRKKKLSKRRSHSIHYEGHNIDTLMPKS
ncbi:myoblast growth factor receptor egl-15 isoform X2 [Hydra vulgaris]|uniref:Myoblast growth factor receptor egl-15 isoform X2 n=1 Tax=Hydra vulgaris TaxID=6087 RepID=A0ABM4BKX0_HYDVU